MPFALDDKLVLRVGEALENLERPGAIAAAVELLRTGLFAEALELARADAQGAWPQSARDALPAPGLVWPQPGAWAFPLRRRGTVVAVLVGRGGAPAEGAKGVEVVLSLVGQLFGAALELAASAHGGDSLDRETALDRHRLGVEISQEGFFDFDVTLGEGAVTPRLLALFDLPATPAAPRLAALAACVHSEDAARWAALFDGSHRGTPHETLVRIRHAGGGFRWLRVRALSVWSASGATHRVVGSALDVTTHQTTLAHLERQRSELQNYALQAVELSEFVTRLIHAQDVEEVEVLGAVTLSSMLGFEQTAFVLKKDDGSLVLQTPGASVKSRALSAEEAHVLEPVFKRHASFMELEAAAMPEPLRSQLSSLRLPHATAFALDAGAEVAGVALGVTQQRARPLTDESKMLAVQVCVMLAVSMDRLRDQALIAASRRQLGEAHGLARLGAWTYQVASGRLDWSSELRALYGASSAKDSIPLTALAAHLHPGDVDHALAQFETAVSSRAPHRWRHRVLKPDGAVAHLENVAECERDEHGEPVRVRGASRDITESVVTMQKLEAALEQARRYQTMFMLSSSLQSLLDFQGSFAVVSPMWTTLLGWSAAELVGRRVSEFVHPDDAARVRATTRQTIRSGDPASLTARFATRGGTFRWLVLTLTPDPERQLVYGVGQDITTLKVAEERLRRNEELLRQTGQLARVCGWERTVPGNAVVWSEELYRIVGIPARPSLSVRESLELVPKEARALVEEVVARCTSHGLPFDLEAPVLRPDGQPLWMRIMGQAEQREGRVVRVFGAAQDVTKERLAREEALAASRAKSQFLANMSHEVRTPLNGILGMTQLALDAEPSTEQREYLDSVKTSGENLLSIVNDILDLSKIESGKLELEAVAFDLRRTVFDAVRNQAVRAHAKGLELVVDIGPDVPRHVVGDPLRFGQVLTNLVGNAIKFTAAGEVTVSARRGASESELTVSVKDTGVGVPESRREAIFDAFTQADGATNRRFGGTGLGLTISRELVERMGGRLWVEGAVEVGSLFHFTARLAPAPVQPTRQTLELPVGLKVFLVDDNRAAREALTSVMRQAGVEVRAFSSGKELLSELWSSPEAGQGVTAVLVDQRMPKASGVDVCEALCTSDPTARLPRLLMLDTVDRPGAEDLKRAQVERCLTKPIAPSELFDALQSAAAKEASLPRTTTTPLPRRSPSNLKVLLAEDNPVNARLAVRLLEKLGAQVRHASNGREALEALERAAADVILMDIQMPELDGLETTRLIRAKEAQTGGHVPIVALTANAMKGDDAQCYQAGMDGYLTKPLDRELLKAELERFTVTPSRTGAAAAHPPSTALPDP